MIANGRVVNTGEFDKNDDQQRIVLTNLHRIGISPDALPYADLKETDRLGALVSLDSSTALSTKATIRAVKADFVARLSQTSRIYPCHILPYSPP